MLLINEIPAVLEASTMSFVFSVSLRFIFVFHILGLNLIHTL